MPTYALTHLADETLLASLAALVAKDREATAVLLAHLAEVDAREDAAYKRIRAARAARRFPVLFDAIADGRLHLSGIGLLAAHFTDDNIGDLIAAATHRSKADIEVLVAALAPKPDVATKIRALPAGARVELAPGPVAIKPALAPPPSETSGQLDLNAAPLTNSPPVELAPGPVGQPKPPTTRTKPLAPGRFAFQVTIDQATRDKLERAQALSRHKNPSGDLAVIFGMALDALIEKIEKKKFAATSRPRAAKARPEDADPHYVPNAVKRDVHERDGEQCAFVSESGERCTEPGFLELDHTTPVARGGQPTVEGMRLLCKAHNQYEAERVLGAHFMRAKREAAAAARERSRCSEELPPAWRSAERLCQAFA